MPFLILPSAAPFSNVGEVTRIPLPHLLEMGRAADALMRAAMAGDAESKRGVETVFRSAMTPGPDQGIAIVFAYLLRDTLQLVLRDREGAEPPIVVETTSPEPPANDVQCRRGHASNVTCTLCKPRGATNEPQKVAF